jgi:hypothetical protein
MMALQTPTLIPSPQGGGRPARCGSTIVPRSVAPSSPSPLWGFGAARRDKSLQWSNLSEEGHESYARTAIKGGGISPQIQESVR